MGAQLRSWLGAQLGCTPAEQKNLLLRLPASRCYRLKFNKDRACITHPPTHSHFPLCLFSVLSYRCRHLLAGGDHPLLPEPDPEPRQQGHLQLLPGAGREGVWVLGAGWVDGVGQGWDGVSPVCASCGCCRRIR